MKLLASLRFYLPIARAMNQTEEAIVSPCRNTDAYIKPQFHGTHKASSFIVHHTTNNSMFRLDCHINIAFNANDVSLENRFAENRHGAAKIKRSILNGHILSPSMLSS
jgi:hypothetical protein